MLLLRKPWTTQPPGVVPVSKVWAPSVAIIPTPGAELHGTANATNQQNYTVDFTGKTTGKWVRDYPLYAERRPLKGGGVGIYRNFTTSVVNNHIASSDLLSGIVDSFTVAYFVDLSGVSGAMDSEGFFNASNVFAIQVPAFSLASSTITLRAIWNGHWTGAADASFTNVPFAQGLIPIIVRYANGYKRVQIGRQSQTIAAALTATWTGSINFLDGGGIVGSIFHGMYLFPRYITDDETEQLVQNMYAPLEWRSIWVPEPAAGGGTTYTITPSGGITLSGDSIDVKGKILLPSGGVVLSGTGNITFSSGGTTFTITPSGGVIISGTGLGSRGKIFIPTGGVILSGTATRVEGKIFSPSGGVIFSGTGTVTFNGIPPAAGSTVNIVRGFPVYGNRRNSQ